MHLAATSIAIAANLTLTATLAQTAPAARVTPFSAGKAGSQLPGEWKAFEFGTNKPATEYRLVGDRDSGGTVLHAHAERSSSALTHPVQIDVSRTPVIQWRWKVSGVISTADNRSGSKEDAPARIVLGFDGDKSKLGLKERTAASLARRATGRELPYAQLVYIWSTKMPVGTMIRHPHSDRVRMVVAASGSGAAGKWANMSRNVRNDFRRAFGEEPGVLTDVGVLTDTDNTGETIDAWYGDIRFAPAEKPSVGTATS
jgi:DUF3047 family protein